MSKILTITEARAQMLDLPDQLNEDTVVITRRGRPVMAAMSYEQYESLLETLEILSDGRFVEQLEDSIAQVERGETITLKQLKRNLGL